MIETINVILENMGIHQSLVSFPCTNEGKKAAENHYKKVILELNPRLDSNVLDDALTEGWFEFGFYKVMLSWSTTDHEQLIQCQ